MTQPLGRGINLGNALDVARDETPRLVLEERHLVAVKAAGFDFIRLPVCWSAHAERSAPYTIDGALFERVDRVIEEAIRRDLTVILDVHHYRDLQRNPSRHTARFLALWRQIARRYAASSERLLFELLNEPCDAMTAERWNTLLAQALDVVRESCPDHTVVVGPASNDAAALPALRLPDDDRMLVTIHYYAPMQFTHQGARWLANAEQWVGTVWGRKATGMPCRATSRRRPPGPANPICRSSWASSAPTNAETFRRDSAGRNGCAGRPSALR